MKTLASCGISAVSVLIASLSGLAQPPAGPLSPEEIEARRQSVADLETHIAQREARLAEWARDIVELDARIEKRIEELVKMLAGFRDSQESRVRVSNLKEDVIEGLQRANQAYLDKRREVRELVRTGDTSAAGDLAKFDEHVMKRVDQIAELTKSIPTHQDVDKYESHGDSYWGGYYHENTRITDQWKQDRRDSTHSDMARKHATEAIRENLERLDQRKRELNDSLANRRLTPAQKDLYTSELGQIDAYSDHLNARLRDITTSTGGAGTPVGRDQAHDIEMMVGDIRRDLREDIGRLFRSYDQFVKGRSYLANLRQNLADRKKWLEENAPASN